MLGAFADQGSAYYVDSVAGDDGNAGTQAAPFKTLGQLVTADTASPRGMWNLKKGSVWREQLSAALYSGMHNKKILAYGTSGDAPVLDGASEIATGDWSKTGGRTNVYQAAVTFDDGGIGLGGFRLRIWENGHDEADLLTFVADVATCDSTPGSWTGPGTPSASPTTIYVHTSGSDDPSTNGLSYEYPKRPYCLNGGQYPTDAVQVAEIRGIATRRHAHHDGGLLSARNVYNCTATDGGIGPTGPAHCMWINGYAESCTAPNFITYGNDLPPVKYKSCEATGGLGVGGAAVTAFYFHTGTYEVDPIVKYTLEDCEANNCSTMCGGNTAITVAIIRPTTNCAQLAVLYNVAQFYLVGGTHVNIVDGGNTVFLSNVANSTIFDLRSVAHQRLNYAGFVFDSTCGPASIEGCSLLFDNTVAYWGYRAIAAHQSATATLTFNRNLVSNNADVVSIAEVVSSNNNVFGNSDPYWEKINGVDYYTLAGWKAAGQDAASVAETTTFVGDITTGDTEPVAGSACWTLGAGADAYGDAHQAEIIASIP